MNEIIKDDILAVIENLGDLIEQFRGKTVLITGYKGFLGSNFTSFFHYLNRNLLNQSIHVTLLDNDIVNLEDQISNYTDNFEIVQGSGLDDLKTNSFNFVIHCAGIASPPYYREFPLKTIEVNSIGYWEMLKKINPDVLESFLYFSTSEIYGDPDSQNIPTQEDYRGNVSCTGPRACYDESKRLGETISIAFTEQKRLPIKIVRPFNVYGPFMRLNDKRVIPDFVKFALEEGTIKIFSDGSPTRSFCYTSDAITGFLRVLLLGEAGRPYNIGNDFEETSIKKLANYISDELGGIKISFEKSNEKEYLTDNPQRRCPDLRRARSELGYTPKITPKEGISRIINWYKETYV